MSGAKIIIEAPADLPLEGENRLWLQLVGACAAVPPEATGLSIDTPIGRVVDQGTEFTLDLTGGKGCRLYVFSGLVEVQPAGDAPANRPFQVPQSQRMSYDAASGAVKRIDLSEEHRLSL